MKICHLTSVHPRYDTRIFYKQCVSLAAQGWAVSLIVADGLGAEVNHGVTIADVGKFHGRRQRILKAPQALYQCVLQLNPQVVHFHDPELLLIALKLSQRGFKVIYDVHEDVPKQVLNKAWIPRIARPVVAKVMALLEARVATKLSGIIGATDYITQRFLNANSKSLTIANYPIVAEFNCNTIPWELRQDRLAYIGSISATRGLIPLVDSLALSQLPLDLAGSYSDSAISVRLKLSPGYPHVVYHGQLRRHEVSQLLATVKIGVVTLLPTPSYLESLATKTLEYMLAGIPVIASNFPAWQAMIEGHNCGLMVDPNSATAIATAAKWLLANPREAQQMGENGRAAVLRHYSWEVEQQKLLDFYRNL